VYTVQLQDIAVHAMNDSKATHKCCHCFTAKPLTETGIRNIWQEYMHEMYWKLIPVFWQ